MVQGTEAVQNFVKGMFQWENFIEFVVYNTSFFLLSFTIGNALDNFLNMIYNRIESSGWINNDSNTWLVTQIVLQLILVSAVSYMIRLLVVGVMLAYSSDTTIYDARAVSIIYAFITFSGQNHLKARIEKLNKLADRLM